MSKILFLDIDGPMIPAKAYFLPGQTRIVSVFDPCAVGMLLKLISLTGAKIVISSVHRYQGMRHIEHLFKLNGIPIEHLHDDWHTTMDQSYSRSEEIQIWLDAHPSIEPYIAIDDELLSDTLVKTRCSTYEGFSMANMLECKIALEAFSDVECVPAAVQLQRWKATLDFIRS